MKCKFILIILILLNISCSANSKLIVSQVEKETFFEGVFLNPRRSSERGEFGLTSYVVKGLKKESILYKMGLRERDIIMSVNDRPFSKKFTAGHLTDFINGASYITFEVRSATGEKILGANFYGPRTKKYSVYFEE